MGRPRPRACGPADAGGRGRSASGGAAGFIVGRELIAQDPVPESVQGSATRRLAYRVASRLMRPVVAHQRQVDERLVGEMTRQQEAQIAARREAGAQTALVLGELRRVDSTLRTLPELAQRITTIEAGTQAIPYMAGQPFGVSHQPGGGGG